jgi:hypothetical protein
MKKITIFLLAGLLSLSTTAVMANCDGKCKDKTKCTECKKKETKDPKAHKCSKECMKDGKCAEMKKDTKGKGKG